MLTLIQFNFDDFTILPALTIVWNCICQTINIVLALKYPVVQLTVTESCLEVDIRVLANKQHS